MIVYKRRDQCRDNAPNLVKLMHVFFDFHLKPVWTNLMLFVSFSEYVSLIKDWDLLIEIENNYCNHAYMANLDLFHLRSKSVLKQI